MEKILDPAAIDGPFVFVDCSSPSNIRAPETRKRIHQHSMRDVGRSRRKPKKEKKRENLVLDVSALQSSGKSEEKAEDKLKLSGLSWWAGSTGIDPFLNCPVDIDDTARNLVLLSKF
jgi:hypothetical protein